MTDHAGTRNGVVQFQMSIVVPGQCTNAVAFLCAQGVECIGELEAAGYNIAFYCLDLLVSARVVGWNSSALGTLVLQYQAEDREFFRILLDRLGLRSWARRSFVTGRVRKPS